MYNNTKMTFWKNREKGKEKEKICLGVMAKLFRIQGSWPKSEGQIWYKCYSFFVIFTLSSFVCVEIYGILFVYNWQTVNEALEDIFVILSPTVSLIKIVTVLYYNKRIKGIMYNLNRSWVDKYLDSDSERELIKKGIRSEKKMAIIFGFICHGITISYVYLSIVKILRYFNKAGWIFYFKNITTVRESNKSLVPLNYPFVLSNVLSLSGAYFHILAISFGTTHSTMTADVATWALLNYHCLYFDILRKKITNEDERTVEERKALRKKCVEQHLEIIRSISEIQSIFGPMLFVQYTLTSGMICLGLFQAIRFQSMSMLLYIKNLFYTSWKITQLFMHCYFGQKLIDQSSNIGYAVYESKWYNVNEGKNDQLLMMMRSQKEVTLKAAGIFTVCLETFMTVLQSSYSYLTLLMTVANK